MRIEYKNGVISDGLGLLWLVFLVNVSNVGYVIIERLHGKDSLTNYVTSLRRNADDNEETPSPPQLGLELLT